MRSNKKNKEVDYFVDPRPLSDEEKQLIHEQIAYYKKNGKKMPLKRTSKNKGTAKKES